MKSYGQACSLALALDVIGGRWSLLLVRELLAGPRRFKDLLANLPGVGTNLLTDRLRELETCSVIEVIQLPPPASARAYALTDLGARLQPAIVALARWGQSQGDAPEGAFWSPMWNTVALQARFQSEQAENLNATVQFDIEGYVYRTVIREGHLQVIEGHSEVADVFVNTDKATFYDVFVAAKESLESAISSGQLTLGGDRGVFERCVQVFTTPQRG